MGNSDSPHKDFREVVGPVGDGPPENKKSQNKHGEVIRAKYELICSHTARRSGTTNLYKLGVLSDLELRSITGHESQKNFEGYIRIGISEQAQRVGDKIKAAREAMKK